MDKQNRQMLALHAIGEYLMNHIGDVMVSVEDMRSQKGEHVLDEETLITIEAEVKTIAEGLITQSQEPSEALRLVRSLSRTR